MGVVLMLITIVGLFAAFFLLLFAFWKNVGWLKIFVVGSVSLWMIFYFALLLGVSLKSRKTFLPNNRAKAFCGFYLDCHLKMSVSNVRKTKEIGGIKAQGTFYIIRVKVMNDAVSVPLAMKSPDATMFDEGGRLYSRREKAERQLPEGAAIPFDQLIPPGGSFEKEIVFDLTEPSKKQNLLVTDTHGINRLIEAFLIGDEDSLFHEKTLFIVEMDTSS